MPRRRESKKPPINKCEIAEELREDMNSPGSPNITEENCLQRNGCWKRSDKPGVPWCYKPDSEAVENQVEDLCGKHSLNNIFLEEKFVWIEDGPLFIGGEDPKAKETKINLWNLCEIYASELKAEETAPAIESKMKTIQAYLSYSNVPNRVQDYEGHSQLKNIKLGKEKPAKMDATYMQKIQAYALQNMKKPFESLNIDEQIKLSADMDYEIALANWKTQKITYDSLYSCKDLKTIEQEVAAQVAAELYIDPDRLCLTRKQNADDLMGQIPIQMFPKIFNMLSLDSTVIDITAAAIESESLGEPIDEDMFGRVFYRRLDSELDKPNLFGILLSSGFHWIGLSKHSNICSDMPGGYALIDSVPASVGGIKRICRDKPALVRELQKYNPKGAVFIYANKHDAYDCKPVRKIKINAKKGGRRTKKAKNRY